MGLYFINFFIFQRFSWDILSHVLLIDNMTIYIIKLKAGRGCAAYLSRRGCGCLIVKYIHNLMFTSFYCSVKEWAVFFFCVFFFYRQSTLLGELVVIKYPPPLTHTSLMVSIFLPFIFNYPSVHWLSPPYWM